MRFLLLLVLVCTSHAKAGSTCSDHKTKLGCELDFCCRLGGSAKAGNQTCFEARDSFLCPMKHSKHEKNSKETCEINKTGMPEVQKQIESLKKVTTTPCSVQYLEKHPNQLIYFSSTGDPYYFPDYEAKDLGLDMISSIDLETIHNQGEISFRLFVSPESEKVYRDALVQIPNLKYIHESGLLKLKRLTNPNQPPQTTSFNPITEFQHVTVDEIMGSIAHRVANEPEKMMQTLMLSISSSDFCNSLAGNDRLIRIAATTKTNVNYIIQEIYESPYDKEIIQNFVSIQEKYHNSKDKTELTALQNQAIDLVLSVQNSPTQKLMKKFNMNIRQVKKILEEKRKKTSISILNWAKPLEFDPVAYDIQEGVYQKIWDEEAKKVQKTNKRIHYGKRFSMRRFERLSNKIDRFDKESHEDQEYVSKIYQLENFPFKNKVIFYTKLKKNDPKNKVLFKVEIETLK